MIQTAEEFIRLRCSEDPELYTRAAYEPAFDDVWLDVINHYPEMKQWVIHNKTVPLSILQILLDDPDPKIRYWVATKRKLTADMFRKLAQDEDESVRFRVVCNAKTPPVILFALANDSSADVAMAARERMARESG